jgi:hypothetical protein
VAASPFALFEGWEHNSPPSCVAYPKLRFLLLIH